VGHEIRAEQQSTQSSEDWSYLMTSPIRKAVQGKNYRCFVWVNGEVEGAFVTFNQARKAAEKLPKGTRFSIQEGADFVFTGRSQTLAGEGEPSVLEGM
jgi:hypothetical protein